MSFSIPLPSAEVLALVQACSPYLRSTGTDELQRAMMPPEKPNPAQEPTEEQLEAVYNTASQLCDEGNFRFASALALHLVTYKPTEARFSFIAGTCMQRLGAPTNAARFFCFALINGGDNPAVLYRLGECLLAAGDRVNAEAALEAALEVARDVEGARELQLLSEKLIDGIRTASRAGNKPSTGAGEAA